MSESATAVIPEPMPLFGPVQLAAAGFLARYSGRTRDACALDLKTYFAWCAARGTEVFAMTRPHVEVYGRWMEEQRRYTPATTARRLSDAIGAGDRDRTGMASLEGRACPGRVQVGDLQSLVFRGVLHTSLWGPRGRSRGLSRSPRRTK